jgi:hypothetical protein
MCPVVLRHRTFFYHKLNLTVVIVPRKLVLALIWHQTLEVYCFLVSSMTTCTRLSFMPSKIIEVSHASRNIKKKKKKARTLRFEP